MIQYASLKEVWGYDGNPSVKHRKNCKPKNDPMAMLYDQSKTGKMEIDNSDFASFYDRIQCEQPTPSPRIARDPTPDRYAPPVADDYLYGDVRTTPDESSCGPTAPRPFGGAPCLGYGTIGEPVMNDFYQYADAYGMVAQPLSTLLSRNDVQEPPTMPPPEPVVAKHSSQDSVVDTTVVVDGSDEPFEAPVDDENTEQFYAAEAPPHSRPLSGGPAQVQPTYSTPRRRADSVADRWIDVGLYVFSGILLLFMLEQVVALAHLAARFA